MLDFTNPNAGFQLPPEVLQYLQQQGNPMAAGLMGAPAAPAPAGVMAPRPPMSGPPGGPATLPAAPVLPPIMDAGQASLLDAGSAMLLNSRTSLGQALGAGLATGKASFIASKNAEADRAMQQQQRDLYYKMLNDSSLGLSPQQLALAKAMPAAQGLAELAKVGFTPKTFAQNNNGQVLQTGGPNAGTVTHPGAPTPVAAGASVMRRNADGSTMRDPATGNIVWDTAPEKPTPQAQDEYWNTAAGITTAGATIDPAKMTPEQRQATLNLENTIRRSSANKQSTIIQGANEVQKATIAQLTPSKTAATSAENALSTIADAKAKLAAGIYSGALGGAQQTVGNLLVSLGLMDPTTVSNTQAYQAYVTKNIIPLLRDAKVSRITNYDIQLFSKPAGASTTMTAPALLDILNAAEGGYRHTVEDHNTLSQAVLGSHYADALPAWLVPTPWKSQSAASASPQRIRGSSGKYYVPDGKGGTTLDPNQAP